MDKTLTLQAGATVLTYLAKQNTIMCINSVPNAHAHVRRAPMMLLDGRMQQLPPTPQKSNRKLWKALSFVTCLSRTLWKALHEAKKALEVRVSWMCTRPRRPFCQGAIYTIRVKVHFGVVVYPPGLARSETPSRFVVYKLKASRGLREAVNLYPLLLLLSVFPSIPFQGKDASSGLEACAKCCLQSKAPSG